MQIQAPRTGEVTGTDHHVVGNFDVWVRARVAPVDSVGKFFVRLRRPWFAVEEKILRYVAKNVFVANPKRIQSFSKFQSAALDTIGIVARGVRFAALAAEDEPRSDQQNQKQVVNRV